jgi:hypothetical protein
VGEIFHNDEPLLRWFEGRVGNHINIIRLADRLSAMLDGHRPQKPAAAPSTSELDAQIADFAPNGKHYAEWLGGNEKLNQLRIRLYSQRHRGKITIE